MKKIFSSLLCIFSLMAASIDVKAHITYLTDSRSTSHTLLGTNISLAAFADLTDTNWAWEAGTHQTSSLTSTGMSGLGWTYAGYDAMIYGVEVSSDFRVTSGVDELTDFSLDGYLGTG